MASVQQGDHSAREIGFWRGVTIRLCVVLATLAVAELIMRVADFRDERLLPEDARLQHEYDPELGWALAPNNLTPAGVHTNNTGLRDAELETGERPTILFLGDSLVYGRGVGDHDRFTDRLRELLPAFRIVNAGVAGYGTDQEYLLMKRLWPRVEPSIVVLVFCVDNDHENNSNDVQYGQEKPYLAKVGDEWKFLGIPTRKGPAYYCYHNWFAQHSALVRLGFVAFNRFSHIGVTVPDPTTQLIGMMRKFVESHQARFLVGLQYEDPELEPYLAAEGIPYVRFDGAETLPEDTHWSFAGHVTVARRIMDLFVAQKTLETVAAAH
jgi:hypothetical protein